jgi:GNAT superfamily N-acetyltransferase
MIEACTVTPKSQAGGFPLLTADSFAALADTSDGYLVDGFGPKHNQTLTLRVDSAPSPSATEAVKFIETSDADDFWRRKSDAFIHPASVDVEPGSYTTYDASAIASAKLRGGFVGIALARMYLYLEPVPERHRLCIELSTVWVHPNYRKQGLGRELLFALANQFRKHINHVARYRPGRRWLMIDVEVSSETMTKGGEAMTYWFSDLFDTDHADACGLEPRKGWRIGQVETHAVW